MNGVISKKELMELGYKESTAKSIIRQTKQVLVNEGYAFYNNKRLGVVPIKRVEAILGCKLEVGVTQNGNN